MNSSVKTRFAPSPTGYLHVGGIRTALFAWLIARQQKGTFVLRIEDTDQAREVSGSADHIQESLNWLGLTWDEGPYFQSQRLDIYKQYAQKLVDEGKAYADPYTPEEVQAFRDQARANKQPFLYRNHRPENPPAWDGTQPLRLKAKVQNWDWSDEVMGAQHAGPESQDDFILMKSDGFPTYNFAHIIDDRDMGITHVIRGQEFLASTPNYLNLYKALGFEAPTLATVPPIMNEQGNKKLSKRDGAKDLLDYRNEGYLPEAINNFLASLGWNDGTEQEVFTVDELIQKFDLSRVQNSGARFDERRLLWINGSHIRNLGLNDLYDKVATFWPESAKNYDEQYQKAVLSLVQERLKYFAELPELTNFFFEDLPVNPELISGHKQLKKIEKNELNALLTKVNDSLTQISDWNSETIQVELNTLLEQTGQKPAVLFSLVRIATTQAAASPSLAESLEVLGKERTLNRIATQLEHLA